MKELAFNELSFEESVPPDFLQFFNNWVSLKKMFRLSDYPRIRFTSQQMVKRNNSNCSFRSVIENSNLDEIQIKVFYNQINNEPFIDDTYPDKLQFEEKKTFGLTDAYYFEIPCISIPSNEIWKSYIIRADKLDINTEEQFVYCKVYIKNIGHLKNYNGTWFEQLLPELYSNVNEYIDYMENNYQHIILSKATKEFLNDNFSQTILDKFEYSVSKLNEYSISYWKRENVLWRQIKDLGLNARPESAKTLEKYGYQRNFKNEINKNEIFSYHFDMPNSRRAYLKEIIKDKRFYIANIVSHLDTVQG